jgi:hypothetical protein
MYRKQVKSSNHLHLETALLLTVNLCLSMYMSVANLILKLQTIHGGARIGVQTVDEAHYCFCAASELASSCAKLHIPPRLLLFVHSMATERKHPFDSDATLNVERAWLYPDDMTDLNDLVQTPPLPLRRM